MGKLGNYILNVFLSFILLFVAIFFFWAEHYLIAVMIVLALLVYLLLCDVYFPSVGNIKNFAFTENDIFILLPFWFSYLPIIETETDFIIIIKTDREILI